MESPADFGELNDRARPVNEGIFSFELDKGRLVSTMGAVQLCLASAKDGASPVQMTLLPTGRVKLASFNQISFAETLIELGKPVDGLPAFGIALVLDAITLSKVAASFSKGEIGFQYDAARALVTVRQGGARVEVRVLDPKLFPPYRAKLGMPQKVKDLPLGLLRKAFDYAGLFTREEIGQDSLAVVSIQDLTLRGRRADGVEVVRQTAVALGGSMTTLAALQAPELMGLNINLKQSGVTVAEKMLLRMAEGEAELFDTPSYYVMSSPGLFFGVEKAPQAFPARAARSYLQAAPEHVVEVARSELKSALARLSCSGAERDSLVEMGVVAGEENRLALSITDAAGRTAEDSLPVGLKTMRKTGRTGYLTAAITLADLTRIVRHQKDDTVQLTFAPSAVVLYDKGENWNTTTILQSVSADVSRRRATR